MKAFDEKNKTAKAALQKALENNDTEAFAEAFEQLMSDVAEDIKAEFEQTVNDNEAERDSAVLSARGVRQLTGEEKKYYQALSDAMRSNNPKQAIANLNVVLPETVINSVFDELRTAHPLLNKINFMPTKGAIKMLMNTNGFESATWGKLCAEIVQELTSGFKEVDTGLFKLSAFIPVCKAMLELGPEWLDRYVREILYEALANGLEYGIVDGTGKDMPIGMTRQVGDDVVVVAGEYPRKNAIPIFDLTPSTVGNLVSFLSVGAGGKTREVRDVIFLVNPLDYFGKIMPATTIMAPDGTYRNDVMPYPMDVIRTNAVPAGKAVIGIAYRYFAAAGIAKEGRIEYSDEFHFLEDERVYLIKTYANGMPMDNNAFLYLDISGIKPATYRVTVDGTVNTVEVPAISAAPIAGTETVLGKSVSELQTGVNVVGGVITGTLNYVTGYTGFSGDPAEQEGNYLAVHFDSAENAVVTIELLGGNTAGPKTLDADGDLVARITSKYQQLRVVSTLAGATNTTVYSLAGLTLAEEEDE